MFECRSAVVAAECLTSQELLTCKVKTIEQKYRVGMFCFRDCDRNSQSNPLYRI